MASKKKAPARRKARTGIRYDAKKRKQILDFVENYNKEHGRGGLSNAVRKFNTSALSIYRWMEEAS